MSFVEALKNRRSIYALGRNVDASNDQIVALLSRKLFVNHHHHSTAKAHVLLSFWTMKYQHSGMNW